MWITSSHRCMPNAKVVGNHVKCILLVKPCDDVHASSILKAWFVTSLRQKYNKRYIFSLRGKNMTETLLIHSYVSGIYLPCAPCISTFPTTILHRRVISEITFFPQQERSLCAMCSKYHLLFNAQEVFSHATQILFLSQQNEIISVMQPRSHFWEHFSHVPGQTNIFQLPAQILTMWKG